MYALALLLFSVAAGAFIGVVTWNESHSILATVAGVTLPAFMAFLALMRLLSPHRHVHRNDPSNTLRV